MQRFIFWTVISCSNYVYQLIEFQSPYQLGGAACDSRQHCPFSFFPTFKRNRKFENFHRHNLIIPKLIVSDIEFCRWNDNLTWSVVCFISASRKTRALLVKPQTIKCNSSPHSKSVFFKFDQKNFCSAGYLFLVIHKILSITLNLLGIEVLTFPKHLLQLLLCLPPKQEGVRNRGKCQI